MSNKLAVGAVLLLAAAVPFAADSFWLNLLTLALIYIPMSMGLTVLFGQTNLVSFGQGGFFAVGAYVSALLTLERGWNVWAAVLAATVSATVVGYVIARPVLRLKGLSLAMATLAFGQMVFILVQQLEITGGPVGLSGIPAPSAFGIDFAEPRNFYWLALVLAAVVYAVSRNLTRSRYGRMFHALAGSEVASRTVGVNTSAVKTLAFCYAATLAGVAGALYAHYFSFISSDTFGLELSLLVVIIVVVGGMRSLSGAIVGTLLVFLLREYLRSYQEYSELVYGLLLILVFMYAPGGVTGTARELWRRLTGPRSRRGGSADGRSSRPTEDVPSTTAEAVNR